jgi:hypothetical protein
MTKTKLRVMIATPTQGTVKIEYMKTIISTMVDLSSRGIDSSFQTSEGADVAFQRNELINKFLIDHTFTHVLFVDSDMAVPANTAATLLNSNKPIVGLICTTRTFNYSNVVAAIEAGTSPKDAQGHGFEWIVFTPENATQIKIENNLMEVGAIGFGYVLIARSALETMVSHGAAREFKHRYGTYLDFFHARPQDINKGVHHSEDISFCLRWRTECGGKIWGFTGASVYHIGDYAYGGAFGDHFMTVRGIVIETH